MNTEKNSIFREYFSEQPFFDRYIQEPEIGVDVIIPVIHTNELWEANLFSFYREIPIHSLLISDGGCIDDSIEIVKKFPRVKVLDHSAYISLGYCIRKLIEAVRTEWFVYLHSDVYLPKKWYDSMEKYQSIYDWYECRQILTGLIEYQEYSEFNRPLSGSQMGKSKAFKKILPLIDDDYLYRNEDIIFAELIKKQGYKYGQIDEIFHYHQHMYKPSSTGRKIKSIQLNLEMTRDEEIRTALTQVKGIIKYLSPNNDPAINYILNYYIKILFSNKILTLNELEEWAQNTNPIWIPVIKNNDMKGKRRQKVINAMIRSYKYFTDRFLL